MTSLKFGFRGDMFRSPTPVGFTMPMPLSLTAVQHGMRQNPLAVGFELTVNQFARDAAESIAESFETPVKVVVSDKFGKDEWILAPQG